MTDYAEVKKSFPQIAAIGRLMICSNLGSEKARIEGFWSFAMTMGVRVPDYLEMLKEIRQFTIDTRNVMPTNFDTDAIVKAIDASVTWWSEPV